MFYTLPKKNVDTWELGDIIGRYKRNSLVKIRGLYCIWELRDILGFAQKKSQHI